MVVKKSTLSWITVSNLARAKQFFIDLLGLEIVEESLQFGWVELKGRDGGSIIGLAQSQPQMSIDNMKAGSNAIITMEVDNLEDQKSKLEQKNVKFLGNIQEIPGHVKLALFSDPDGNLFQLVEKLS